MSYTCLTILVKHTQRQGAAYLNRDGFKTRTKTIRRVFVGRSWKDLFLFSSFCWLICDNANETRLRIIWKTRVEGLSRVLAKEKKSLNTAVTIPCNGFTDWIKGGNGGSASWAPNLISLCFLTLGTMCPVACSYHHNYRSPRCHAFPAMTLSKFKQK